MNILFALLLHINFKPQAPTVKCAYHGVKVDLPGRLVNGVCRLDTR